MFIEARHKLGISITNDKLWHHVMPDSHVEEQLNRVKSCCDCFNWSHLCQFGESINYHKNGIHPIPFK
jgi:hypothetical protein